MQSAAATVASLVAAAVAVDAEVPPAEMVPVAEAPAAPVPLSTAPAPMRAGLRSRVRNMPLTDAEADALGGAGIPADRPAEPVVEATAEPEVVEATVAPEVKVDVIVEPAAPLTRRSRRAAEAPVAEAPAAEAPAPEAPAPEAPAAVTPAPETPAAETPASETPADEVVEELVFDVPASAESDSAPDAQIPVEEEPETPTPEEPAAETPAAEAPADSPTDDEFAAAIRLFGVTGETPTVPPVADASDAPTTSSHAVPRGARTAGSNLRRLTTASFSIGVMGIVGLLAVGMTTPVEAVAAAQGGTGPTASIVALAGTDAGTDATDDIQAYVAPAEAATADLRREEGYAAVTMSQLAVESGIRDTAPLYVNNAASAVQWPFPVGVPMSSGFGLRWGSMHNGVDLIPGGEGAPIRAIADGIIRISSEAGGSYGVHVIIDHVINGELVSTHYAHMQRGSLRFQPGDTVKVGDTIGTVGNTGRSTGPHLHFEVLLNGTTATDPLPWMAEHNVPETVVTLPGAVVTATE